MNFRRMLAMPVVASLLAVFAISSPAQAAWSDCSNYPGTICLFANANWGLPIWRQYPSQIGSCRNLSGFDNVTTIAVNQATHHSVILHQYLNCEGEQFTLPAVGNYADFSGSWWNDRPSSVEVVAF